MPAERMKMSPTFLHRDSPSRNCYCGALNDGRVIIKRSIRANYLQTRHSVSQLLNSLRNPLSPVHAVLLQLIFRSRRTPVFAKFYTLVLSHDTRHFSARKFRYRPRRSSMEPTRMETNFRGRFCPLHVEIVCI